MLENVFYLCFKQTEPRIQLAGHVIPCTGFSATVDEDRARSIGIRAFVHKPILRHQICSIVRQVLDQPMGNTLLTN